MANINKIKLSGTSYDIQDSNAARSITLTQAEYDALQNKDPNVFYIISDSNVGYITSAETESAITQAVSGKTDTSAFTSHTSDSSIHVTTAQTAAWNAKSDFSGSYNDLTDKPTLFSGSYNDLTDKPTIPSKTSDLTNDSNFATSAYVDTKLSISDFNTYSGTVNTAIGNKANSSDVYTKSQTSGATEISTALNAKLDTTAYTPTDLSNYYQKSETSGATEIATALSGKQDTLSAGTNITIVDNVISAEGGGGKAIAAGTNISVTTGETADTINCTIPAYFHTNTIKGDINIGSNEGISSDYGRLVIGRRVQSRGNPYFQYSIGIGVQPDNSNNYCQLYGQNSVGIGRGFKIGSDSLYANGINNAVAIGHNATSRDNGDVTLGASTTASGGSSVAIGSGATANGSDYKMNLNNQIKVTPTNQVYIYNKDNTEMICLQDALGGGGGIDSGTVQTMIDESISGKADTSSLATVATSGSYDDLTNKPTIPTVPTSNTAFTNDAGYITSSALDGYATEQWVGQQGYLTQHQDISGKQDVSGMTAYTEVSAFTAHTADTTIHVTTAQTAAWDAKQNALTIDSTVTSGSTNPVQGGAVYTQLGGLKLVKLSQSEYDALSPDYDANTLYVIVN